MEIVLLERVEKLGQMGDVVQVKDGYARNFLLPQGKALRATGDNLKRFENDRAQLEARNLEAKKEADAVASKLDGSKFVVIRQASEAGSLYGSVTARDVAEAATEGGYSVEKRQVVLEKPVKELGLHEMRVVLHPEVSASITINVARSVEEAELQEQGKTVADMRAEQEEEDEFDVSELFEDDAAPEGMEVIDPDGDEKVSDDASDEDASEEEAR